ncbi:hypothetical protein [Methylobacter sp. S3L5C]|uniref:hypothetical protein n=1 Tax=Methylobacter sp. S3L5C TaxID=2839024 RepID=UPI001FAE3DE3|nr:hypothetical protein [Methylobacter sp. S3L5C]UOA08129.1 hypothetical protein KKZ03_18200 [Methylobacter sp. S3L5C]
MKKISVLYWVIVLLGSITSPSLWAGRGYGYDGRHYGGGYGGAYGYGGRSNYSFYLNAPIYPYYPNRYPYYPPTVITIPVTPPVYIQQPPPPPQQQQYPAGYWYYCNNPEGYYPYVKECPLGWQQVNPIPPAPR